MTDFEKMTVMVVYNSIIRHFCKSSVTPPRTPGRPAALVPCARPPVGNAARPPGRPAAGLLLLLAAVALAAVALNLLPDCALDKSVNALALLLCVLADLIIRRPGWRKMRLSPPHGAKSNRQTHGPPGAYPCRFVNILLNRVFLRSQILTIYQIWYII